MVAVETFVSILSLTSAVLANSVDLVTACVAQHSDYLPTKSLAQTTLAHLVICAAMTKEMCWEDQLAIHQ